MPHSCGNEHPCQFRMHDVEINPGDRFTAKTLAQTFLYYKTEVPLNSTLTLVKCTNLGGAYMKGEETDVK